MEARKVARPERDDAELRRLVHEHKVLKDTQEAVEQRLKANKQALSELVELNGEPDDKGHIVLDLPDDVDGYSQLVRQRRASRKLDENYAERLLEQKNLAERCYRNVPVLDEEEVMQAHFEGLLTEEEIDDMFPTKVSWAFLPVKDK